MVAIVLTVIIFIVCIYTIISTSISGKKMSSSSYNYTTVSSDCKVGDVVKFGSYYSENKKHKTPIEWIVLEKLYDETAVLISKYALDSAACASCGYWPNSSIRKWLNDYFYNTAFSTNEQARILVTGISSTNIFDSKIEQIKEIYTKNSSFCVEDKVFLLNEFEIANYFSVESLYDTESARLKCTPTMYAKTCGVDISNGFCPWALRVNFEETIDESITSNGGLRSRFISVNYTDYDEPKRFGIRPAIKIKL